MSSVNDQITDSVTIGRKFDGGKPMFGLLPPKALKATVDVLTFGAQKYEVDNWRYVDDSLRRYFDASQRHLWDWKEGEKYDPESGLHHLAHAICCLMFLYEHDVMPQKETKGLLVPKCTEKEFVQEGIIDKFLDKVEK
jgi:hypothetical protein